MLLKKLFSLGFVLLLITFSGAAYAKVTYYYYCSSTNFTQSDPITLKFFHSDVFSIEWSDSDFEFTQNITNQWNSYLLARNKTAGVSGFCFRYDGAGEANRKLNDAITDANFKKRPVIATSFKGEK